MNIKTRKEILYDVEKDTPWDVIIIGGGATGLGCAVDAASRGLRTLLLEQHDFAKGTSSRSTKLVHGGVRYLAQGNIKLVREALKERGILIKNAPHLVHKQSFVIPCFNWFSKLKYLTGLKLYDWLSVKSSFGPSKSLGKIETIEKLKGISTDRIFGGVEYYDGQFDDARLAINLAQTALEKGASVLNYAQVTRFIKNNDQTKLAGLSFKDQETNQEYIVYSNSIINATGVFVDEILSMDNPETAPTIKASQGVHIVLNRSFMSGSSALMLPKTSDGRVLFAVPWHQHLLIGTTDTPLNSISIEPQALQQEIDFILQNAGIHLKERPSKYDILSVFAGLRPLVTQNSLHKKTKELSRSHKILVSKSGLITIIGGKWTTYRKMAEDTVNKLISINNLKTKSCCTENLKIHGYINKPGNSSHLNVYGSDMTGIIRLAQENPQLKELLNENFPYIAAEVIWSVRYEMARTIEDILARRLRILFVDAKAAMDIAPKVASLMAAELEHTPYWEKKQLIQFTSIAQNYIASNYKLLFHP